MSGIKCQFWSRGSKVRGSNVGRSNVLGIECPLWVGDRKTMGSKDRKFSYQNVGDRMFILGSGIKCPGSNVHFGVGDQMSGDQMSGDQMSILVLGIKSPGIKCLGIKCPRDRLSTFGSEIKCPRDRMSTLGRGSKVNGIKSQVIKIPKSKVWGSEVRGSSVHHPS